MRIALFLLALASILLSAPGCRSSFEPIDEKASCTLLIRWPDSGTISPSVNLVEAQSVTITLADINGPGISDPVTANRISSVPYSQGQFTSLNYPTTYAYQITIFNGTNASGNVLANTSGLVAINDQGEKSLVFSANGPVQFSVTEAEKTMIVINEQTQAYATFSNNSGERLLYGPTAITWKSSDESVATVDSSGRVTGVLPGNVRIIATVGGASTEVLITVTNP